MTPQPLMDMVRRADLEIRRAGGKPNKILVPLHMRQALRAEMKPPYDMPVMGAEGKYVDIIHTLWGKLVVEYVDTDSDEIAIKTEDDIGWIKQQQ